MSLREQISLAVFGLMILAICGLEILLVIRYVRLRIRQGSWKGIRFTNAHIALHGLVAVGILCLLYSYFVEPYWIEVSRVTIRTPKLRETGFRIVQISDLHCDRDARNEERAVRIISGLKPDVIVATGDYLNDERGLPRLRDMFRRLDAPLGKFAVTGNWDERRGAVSDLLEDTGFHQLERDRASIAKTGERINIAGLSLGRTALHREVLQGAPDEHFDVFLFHTPDLIEDVRSLGVDLYLCGHTHGGQIALPLYGALITFSRFGKKYESGLHRVDGTMLYVNRGLGLEPRPAPQARFFARPEIAVFDILPERP